MHRKTAELEKRNEDLQNRFRIEERDGVIRKQEADQKLEVAEVMEENSQQLIPEQLAMNETLLQETACLKQKNHGGPEQCCNFSPVCDVPGCEAIQGL